MQSSPVSSLEGAAGGTYVAKELVYAYAMWISPAFHLKVIRAYDAMATQPAAPGAVTAPAEIPLVEPEQRLNAYTAAGLVESKQEFANWIKGCIEKYGFVEGEDWVIQKIVNNPEPADRDRFKSDETLLCALAIAPTLRDFHST